MYQKSDIGGFDAARHRNSVELDSQLELRILLCVWLIIFSFSFNYKMRPLKRQHNFPICFLAAKYYVGLPAIID